MMRFHFHIKLSDGPGGDPVLSVVAMEPAT